LRVAEPAGLARRLPILANGVTDQGLGEVTSEARNVAGNAVLAEGQFSAIAQRALGQVQSKYKIRLVLRSVDLLWHDPDISRNDD